MNYESTVSPPALPATSDVAAPALDPQATGPSPQGELAPAPNESGRAFEAYCAYLELGPRRRYSAVARKIGVSLRTIQRWAIQFDWRGRIHRQAAHSAHQFVQTRDAEVIETAAREKSLRERQIVLAEAVLDVTERYFERMDDLDFESMRFLDACRALEFASRLLGQDRPPDPAAAPDQGLRDQLATLLDQAFRETQKPATP